MNGCSPKCWMKLVHCITQLLVQALVKKRTEHVGYNFAQFVTRYSFFRMKVMPNVYQHMGQTYRVKFYKCKLQFQSKWTRLINRQVDLQCYKLSHKRELNTKKYSASHIQRGRRPSWILDADALCIFFQYVFQQINVRVITNLSSSLTCNVQSLKFQNVISRRTAFMRIHAHSCA